MKLACRDAYGKALVELGARNPDIVVLDADLSSSTRTALFQAAFKDRFFNMGVAEQDMVGTAAGLALTGKIPYMSSFAMFATGRAWEPIRNSIGYPNLNVKIVCSHAGLTVGEDGACHQALEDVGIMRMIPNMRVWVPADFYEAEKMIYAAEAVRGPIYIRFGRSESPTLFDANYQFDDRQYPVLRTGSHVAILASGIMVDMAMVAADQLAGDGISATVVNVNSIKPLHGQQLLEIASGSRRIVTVEEHSVMGGLGSAVSELVAENCPMAVVRVGTPDTFGESGQSDDLLKKFGLTPAHIAAAVHRVMDRPV